MFEQQILCHKLSKSFAYLKAHNNEEEWANKRNKIYEIEVQQYEYLYKQELITFKSETFKINAACQIREWDMLMHFVKTYLYHHTNRLIREIRYKESCLHIKLIRHSRRCESLVKSNIIDVYPQIIVDIQKVPLNHIQLEYLSHTRLNYIRPNQSYLYSYKQRQKQLKEEHKNMMNIVKSYLIRIYHMSNPSTIIKQFSQRLETCLYQQYMAPLSHLTIQLN